VEYTECNESRRYGKESVRVGFIKGDVELYRGNQREKK